jgi:membrane-associated HD superfamily phosphohydrolase
MRDAVYVVGGLAIVAFFIARQRRSERFEQRSLLIPAALAVYGLVLLDHTSKQDPFTASSALLLTLSAVASIVFGVFRGRTIELFVRDGELWERASWANLGIGWGGLLVVRLGLIATAAALGATLAASPTSIPLMLAITLAAQMVVVAERARSTDAVIAPSRRGRRRARHRR